MDYAIEKIWDALNSGCVPIYQSSSSIKEIIPDPNTVMLYNDYDHDTKQLAIAIHELMNDDEAYAKKVAWKDKAFNELSPSYQEYMNLVLDPVMTH